jgi:hypothetical protein
MTTDRNALADRLTELAWNDMVLNQDDTDLLVEAAAALREPVKAAGDIPARAWRKALGHYARTFTTLVLHDDKALDWIESRARELAEKEKGK